MIIELLVFLGLAAISGFIGWLFGYGMGVRDYKKNRDFIENG